MDEVFSEAFNIKITRRDLMTLHKLEWLNDEVRWSNLTLCQTNPVFGHHLTLIRYLYVSKFNSTFVHAYVHVPVVDDDVLD